ncbi:MAG: hypothetical protein Q4C86_07635 [bacterium]|nr:hypothetical protein [bacterium]
MAFSQGDLDAICAAIASGALKVKYKDREVQYQSLNDLLTAKAVIEKALGVVGRRVVYPAHSKGV